MVAPCSSCNATLASPPPFMSDCCRRLACDVELAVCHSLRSCGRLDDSSLILQSHTSVIQPFGKVGQLGCWPQPVPSERPTRSDAASRAESRSVLTPERPTNGAAQKEEFEWRKSEVQRYARLLG